MKESPIYINGSKTKYTITSKGDVYSLNYGRQKKKKKLKPCVNKNTGYLCVNLYHKKKMYRKYIHVLVAEAFIPNPDNKPEVNHKNGDKTKNNKGNLEWCTGKENIEHAFSTGLRNVQYGEDAPYVKITEQTVRKICKLLEENKLGSKEIARKVDLPVSYVHNIKHKKCWLKISSEYNIDAHTVKSKPVNNGRKKAEKISKEMAVEICELLAYSNLTLSEIHQQTGVSDCKIKSILYKNGWKDIVSNYDFSKRRKR